MLEKMGSPDKRDAAAKAIREARKTERSEKPYAMNRAGTNYIDSLDGVANLFAYVRSLQSQVVLDVGAGTTRGIASLAKSKMAQGLDFQATALTLRPQADSFLGKEKIHITSAEELRGISDASIGCIIAVQVLYYSAAPELVAQSIDRVLVPGGVLKACNLGGYVNIFRESFEKLGYDVQIQGHRFMAIKNGGAVNISAAELLARDSKTGIKQSLLFPEYSEAA